MNLTTSISQLPPIRDLEKRARAGDARATEIYCEIAAAVAKELLPQVVKACRKEAERLEAEHASQVREHRWTLLRMRIWLAEDADALVRDMEALGPNTPGELATLAAAQRYADHRRREREYEEEAQRRRYAVPYVPARLNGVPRTRTWSAGWLAQADPELFELGQKRGWS